VGVELSAAAGTIDFDPGDMAERSDDLCDDGAVAPHRPGQDSNLRPVWLTAESDTEE